MNNASHAHVIICFNTVTEHQQNVS